MRADAAVFRALADPTRRQILCELAAGELTAGDIASRFPISAPSVSRHLAILRGADLVSERREANRVIYRLEPDRLATTMSGFLSTVCPQQIVLRHRMASRGGDESSERAGTPESAAEVMQ